MSDKEEYQFASDEVQASASTEEEEQNYASAVNPELSERARRITFVIMLIIIGFVVFHFFGGKKADKKEQTAAPEVNAVQSIQATSSVPSEANTASPSS